MPRDCFLIVAGERSGDMYGAALAQALKARIADAAVFGCGGEAMRAAGVETIADIHQVALIGISEVVSGLPKAYRAMQDLVAEAARRGPAAAILIDSPSLNLSLAKRLKKHNIPVIYFVSPQIWAWKKWRIRKIKANVDRMLCLFDFETEIYEKAGVPVECVGHPLLDMAAVSQSRAEFFSRAKLDPNVPTVALLPGSRRTEVRFNLPAILEAADRLAQSRPIQFVVASAPTIDPAWMESLIARGYKGAAPLRALANATHEALQYSAAAVVASGTATIEAALRECPMVVVYRVSAFTAMCARIMIDVPFYSMVNLLAGHAVVPELIQSGFTAARLTEEMERLLGDAGARNRMVAELRKVRERLGKGGAMDRAADAVVRHLEGAKASLGAE
ncbi:MAG TPA: lipid-A-disaccharide synthase [Terriglobia bacterium]|nr:lipid-A-disaccharide synthase [Terriglobia bacterium]